MLIYAPFDRDGSICRICSASCDDSLWREVYRDMKVVSGAHSNDWNVEPVFLFDEAWEC